MPLKKLIYRVSLDNQLAGLIIEKYIFFGGQFLLFGSLSAHFNNRMFLEVESFFLLEAVSN